VSQLTEKIEQLRKTASMLRVLADQPDIKTASISDQSDVLAQVYYEARLNAHLNALGGV
jgi:hypothetical protein